MPFDVLESRSIVPDALTACHLPHARTPDSSKNVPSVEGIPCQQTRRHETDERDTFERVCESDGQVEPVRGAAQEVQRTASRRTGPRRWLRAVEWLIAAGLHGRANATTLAVAQDLAARMDYDSGHVRYAIDGMVARLGISKPTIKRHVAYLRELGALAWVIHGTRTNIRRALGLKGYAGTATVYAATIPSTYDRAMGHTIVGTGYEARIVVDQRHQTPVDNEPVDDQDSEGCEPPSLTVVKEESQVQVEGGFNYTSRKRASRSTTSIPHQTDKRSSKDGTRRRTPRQVEWEIRETRVVRALVNWTQSERRDRRLAYVLRPFFDRGLRAHDIAAELAGMTLGWKPKHPAAFIRAALAEQAAADAQLAADEKRRQESTWQERNAQAAADRASLEVLFAQAERTSEDRLRARMDWNNWREVADHYADDPDDALDLYGQRLCTYAVRMDARTGTSTVTHI